MRLLSRATAARWPHSRPAFADQIVSHRAEDQRRDNQFVTDESPRSDATLENLAKLKPASTTRAR